jgi:putative ABC transport system permease protein
MGISFISLLLSRLGVALRTALESLSRNPLRAGLTGFGILVGVSAVTIVITLGEGAERAVQERIDKLGENLLTIRAESPQASGASNPDRPTLIEADAHAISDNIDGVAHIAPILDGVVRAISGSRNTSAQAIGTTSEYLGARNYKIESGAMWSASQEVTAARVVLVGPKVVAELFAGEEPVGQAIRIGKHLFRVIGVLSEKGQTPFGMDQDNVIVMPLKTMRSKVTPGRPGEVRQIVLAAADGVTTDELTRPIRSLLRQRHHIDYGEGDDFSIRDQSRMAEAQRGIVTVMRMLLLSIAGVSLVIGGIGVMNIMLVSVTERSREIGTRLAVGARGADILTQFLIEAVVLAFLGGALGAALAAALVSPLEGYFGWEMYISSRALATAAGVSVAIGVVFGLLPARRAARLDPVEALRRE